MSVVNFYQCQRLLRERRHHHVSASLRAYATAHGSGYGCQLNPSASFRDYINASPVPVVPISQSLILQPLTVIPAFFTVIVYILHTFPASRFYICLVTHNKAHTHPLQNYIKSARFHTDKIKIFFFLFTCANKCYNILLFSKNFLTSLD